MAIYDVYEDKEYNQLYSEGITRVFGENKCINTDDDAFIASVQPLQCDPEECGLVKIGTVEINQDQ